jgi:hypothetical protein
MYSIIALLFLIGFSMVAAGFIGRIYTNEIKDVSNNVAAAIILLFVFTLLVLSVSSASELAAFFEGICGEIPFCGLITDYGSLKNAFSESPSSAAIAFMDTVILSALIEIITKILPYRARQTAENRLKIRTFMVKILIGMVVALAALLLLNYVIKKTDTYNWIVAVVGSIIALLSTGTIPFLVISQLNANRVARVGLVGALLLFSKSSVAGILRASFLKAIIYVFGIWVLENNFESISNSLSNLSMILLAS